MVASGVKSSCRRGVWCSRVLSDDEGQIRMMREGKARLSWSGRVWRREGQLRRSRELTEEEEAKEIDGCL